MRTCPDGYPSCRHAEASGQWCGNECRAELQKELDDLLVKRTLMHAKHMEKYRSHSATRAQTTTHNANVSNLNDRIISLRSLLKKGD